MADDPLANAICEMLSGRKDSWMNVSELVEKLGEQVGTRMLRSARLENVLKQLAKRNIIAIRYDKHGKMVKVSLTQPANRSELEKIVGDHIGIFLEIPCFSCPDLYKCLEEDLWVECRSLNEYLVREEEQPVLPKKF